MMNIGSMSDEDLDTLLESGGGGVTGLPLDGIVGIEGMLGFLSIAVLIIGSVFLLLFLIMVIMRVREHRATMQMRKDITVIRELLEKNDKEKSLDRNKVHLASGVVDHSDQA